ncbi:retrovirus-related pol polyprotein from transposon TNT 1-94 [Tanacetum coccineum]
MCDKKNSVLFTDTECVVLSPDFKLTDESHVLLKVPRKDNMYSVDLKNVIPQGGLTCLFAKATPDESNLWHRRLGHVNFKTRNKLGIKREFSVARTPQQNRVAEKKNTTLIEAARTMLADSKLPTTFWAEAVNTACYVQNRVLVIKPHNKTPYELFLGRKPALSFMRPFGCLVTILNTIDHLCKFDRNADEGFFVGYSTNSKAFRVFNSRTRIVEENLHVQFSENTPNIAGSGPNWLFDIDALTKSMNYKPITAGNQSNGSAGTKACDNAVKARMETVYGKDYILLPLWTQDSSFSSSLKDSPDTRFKPSGEEEKKDTEDSGNENSKVPSIEEPRVNQEKDDNVSSTNNVNTTSVNNTNTINTVSLTINVVGIEVNVVDPKLSIELPDDPNMPELEDIVYSDGKIRTGKLDFEDLTDESHVLFKVPRKDNMYSVDLKNVIPQGGLTCLFAKATPDESNLWHRRLGHVNFKTRNKLVKGNLVRGLPLKLFEINQTCVACQKRKQHRASCKTKTVSLISQPLQMLHMDLFGPTFVKSLMKKMYCLVVTDDFGIENLIDLKVKVIRCDNGTEFKNRVMNQFCEMKGIKREFSVARTPQQNGVAERKNKTLIEAARTMLADSKLPTTFWAEQNADEGFFVGYSTDSKAFRVFNSRTRIVEENLHVQFSENTPNIAGSGPNWLFDIDALTKSMNYKPVTAGNQSNGSVGTKACDNAVKARIETVSGKDYILLPLWTQDSSFSSSLKDSPDTGFKPSGEEEKKDTEDSRNENSKVPSTKEPRVNQEKDDNVSSTNNVNNASVNNTKTINTVSLTINVAGIEVNVVDPKLSIELPDDPNMPELEDIVYLDGKIRSGKLDFEDVYFVKN